MATAPPGLNKFWLDHPRLLNIALWLLAIAGILFLAIVIAGVVFIVRDMAVNG